MDIEVTGLSKSFGETKVLKSFCGVFVEGAITCIMGSSGCGKTTFLNILMGLVKADSGIIRGISDKKISVVFQEDRLCERFNAIDNIKIVCSKTIDRDSIKRELSLVGLVDGINKPVSTLSGGMKRRVAIVRAILADSDVIIMDEPFKGLDYETKNKVINYIEERTKEKTAIITTHSTEDIELLKATLIQM